jgi:hypothetical protein
MNISQTIFPAVAVALLAGSGAANAGLSFEALSSGASVARTEKFDVTGFESLAVGTYLTLGALKSDQAGTVTFTYLGQESGYINKFYLTIPPTQTLLESYTPGVTSVTASTVAGYVPFKFEGYTDKFAVNSANGSGWMPNTSIGLIGTNMSLSFNSKPAKTYAFVLGYNDSAGTATLGDWDDFVVGVNFVSAVPEPETYALMLAGLGLLAVVARRRKQQSAAA